MNLHADITHRLVLPRWLLFNEARFRNELDNGERVPHIQGINSDNYKGKTEDWQNVRARIYASDLVGTALILNDFCNPIVKDAAEFLIRDTTPNSNTCREIAFEYLRFLSPPKILAVDNRQASSAAHSRIAALKVRLGEYPSNPIAWVDMAFLYASLGQNEKAKRCINFSLGMTRENRFVLRSSARFFVHLGDPDTAIAILRKSNSIKNDPWVLASEIAIAERLGKASTLIRHGRHIIEKGGHSPHDLAELNSALGCMEYMHGSNKKAKGFIRESLIDPNENVVAQAEWMAPKLGTQFIRSKEIPASFEADTRKMARDGRYSDALANAWNWFNYQPFSSSPATFGAYIAGVALGDYESGIRIANAGLRATQGDFMLLNNLAFCLASLGRLEEATSILTQVEKNKLPPKELSTFTATLGLIAYRSGNQSSGSSLYSISAEHFLKQNDFSSAGLAYSFWAREAKIVGDQIWKPLLLKAKDCAKKSGNKELAILEQKIISGEGILSSLPDQHKHLND